MRATLRGSAASAACAFVTASVSGKRAILDARRRSVLDRLRGGLHCAERRTERDRDAEHERQGRELHDCPAFC